MITSQAFYIYKVLPLITSRASHIYKYTALDSHWQLAPQVMNYWQLLFIKKKWWQNTFSLITCQLQLCHHQNAWAKKILAFTHNTITRNLFLHHKAKKKSWRNHLSESLTLDKDGMHITILQGTPSKRKWHARSYLPYHFAAEDQQIIIITEKSHFQQFITEKNGSAKRNKDILLQ